MTLDEFRATGRDVGDLSEYDTLEAQGLSGPGRVYEQELCLEGTAANGYHLTIGNESFTAPLRFLEERLYEWAISEGYLNPDA